MKEMDEVAARGNTSSTASCTSTASETEPEEPSRTADACTQTEDLVQLASVGCQTFHPASSKGKAGKWFKKLVSTAAG